MSPSPTTPRHSRNSSAADSQQKYLHVRRQSKSPTHEPATPGLNGIGQQDNMDIGILNSGGRASSKGMGNLADELADAFSDSGEEDDVEYEHGQHSVPGMQSRDMQGNAIKCTGGGELDSASVPATAYMCRNDNKLRFPVSHGRGNRGNATEYDGSDYGSESDIDCAGMAPTLVAKIDGIESLARRGTENYGGPGDDVFRRVTDGLRDLGSQLTVEGNASRLDLCIKVFSSVAILTAYRLITAHTALTTHLTHQTRQIHGLTFTLISPLAPTLDGEAIDDIVPLLVSLSDQMPRPSTFAFNSLTALHTITSELIQTLSYLSDTLHMSRQTTATATRRLKSAKELVIEIRRDEELREEGERWLSRGNWSQRLESRECANICGEVIGGFEDVCNDWRQRLLAQAEAQA
ncbi:hypothetical protein QQS21_001035 [Conoideocrella luteorostrata]|uniref:Uncharacterized protein n=1 Tax=Conoideocrella luteorostrata TaxID=1105319 RepID=A0AAJ0CXS7_9HYPO|nr:hypothetical protein QQS21_001035 [Conoideocrella luteorostrata]